MRATRDYLIHMPRDVTVVAASEDVGCSSWLYGWETHVDEATPLGHVEDGAALHRLAEHLLEAEGLRAELDCRVPAARGTDLVLDWIGTVTAQLHDVRPAAEVQPVGPQR